jgi:hypothetical protein
MELTLEEFRKQQGYDEMREIVKVMKISKDVEFTRSVQYVERTSHDLYLEAEFAKEFARDVRFNSHVLEFGNGDLAKEGVSSINSRPDDLINMAKNQEDWSRIQSVALCDELISQLPLDLVSSQTQIMLEVQDQVSKEKATAAKISLEKIQMRHTLLQMNTAELITITQIKGIIVDRKDTKLILVSKIIADQ